MTKLKTIWMINQYASTPDTGMGGRHFYLAEELAKQGHRVYVIASAFSHLLHTRPALEDDFKIEQTASFNFVWVKMPAYAQAHSKQRILNWFLFPWRIQQLAKIIPDAPDVVLCSSPSLISFLGAQRLAKRFEARLVFEVRDIWPRTLMELGGHSSKNPLIRFLQWVERKAYRDADLVLSNLRNAVEHMVEQGLHREKFAWIPNGFSLTEVERKSPLSSTVKGQLPKDKFVVGYTGTLGVANSLESLIAAAELLKKETDIAFVLVGNGKEGSRLKQSVQLKGLANVIFIDPIPKVQIQSMLQEFDACFIGCKNEEIYNFGIAANKIPEYLFAAKPVVHAYSGACDPIEQYQAGITVEADNAQAIADAVLRLYNMPKAKRDQMGANGHKAAMEQYEYGMLAKKLAALVF